MIDKVTRRRQGAHYTPEEAILKVIGPLFLDDLRAEFARLTLLKSNRARQLVAFQERLGTLRFLDPACGAGNFLVVTYRELRELERDVIRELRTLEGTIQQVLDVGALSKLNVDRFHGIEIDEFPSQIAQVALWMTDHIANTRLGEDFGRPYARIPLVTAPASTMPTRWNSTGRPCFRRSRRVTCSATRRSWGPSTRHRHSANRSGGSRDHQEVEVHWTMFVHGLSRLRTI